jgi:hypothetical protein
MVCMMVVGNSVSGMLRKKHPRTIAGPNFDLLRLGAGSAAGCDVLRQSLSVTTVASRTSRYVVVGQRLRRFGTWALEAQVRGSGR